MIEDNGDPFNPASAAYRPEHPDGAQLIAEERESQVTHKGYSPGHDDAFTQGELLAGAARVLAEVQQDRGDTAAVRGLAVACAENVRGKYGTDHVRRLTIAGALIAAELDRLIRAERARCTHPDRGATVNVTCPKCNTAVCLPADPVDHATDRFCPVCNAQLPFLPGMEGGGS